MFSRLCVALATTVFAFALTAHATTAASLGVSYYVLPGNHPDTGHGVDGVTVKGLVGPRLGPHGFPVATSLARSKGGSGSGPISDVNSDGEIMWWSTASTHGVRLEAVGRVNLPLLNSAMFPQGHTDDSHGYRTARYHATIDASSPLTGAVSLGSDDDAWVFVDGFLRVDNGGVKPMTFTPYSLGHLAAGRHTIDIFYADRHGSQAQIQIDSPLALAPAAPASQPRPVAARAGRPSLTAAQMAAQLRANGHFTLRDIHFAFDKTAITPDSAAVLGEVGKLLDGDPALRLRIEGHTDGVGSAGYNEDLSQRRALAVKTYLVAHAHVAPSRLDTAGFGASRPVASNATAQGQALNRRVEFVKL